MMHDIDIVKINKFIASFMGIKFGWIERYYDHGDEFNYKFVMEPKPYLYIEEDIIDVQIKNAILKKQGTFDGMIHLEEHVDVDYSPYINYHEDWNKLMEVVEKIESLPYDLHHGNFGVYISSNSCTIQGTLLHLALSNLTEYGWVYMSDPEAIFESKIKSTHYAVYKFIEWYTTEYKKEQERLKENKSNNVIEDKVKEFIKNELPLPCNYDYYEIRSGKCPFGDVYNGNVYCTHKDCKQ